MEGKQAFIPHFTKFIGHCAAVNGKKIRQLLTAEGNGKAAAVGKLCLLGKIAYQLFPCGALGYMSQFLHKFYIFACKGNKQILYNLVVKSAGGRTAGQHTPGVKKGNGTVFNCHSIVEHNAVFIEGIGFTEHISRFDNVYNTAVSPVVVFLNMDTALKQDWNTAQSIALAEDIFPFFVLAYNWLHTDRQYFKFFIRYIGEHERLFKHRKKFFHKLHLLL